MQLFKAQSGDEFSQMLDKLMGLIKKQGAPFVLEKAVQGMPVELQETVFALAADMVFADGSVEDEERDLLENLQAKLTIPDDLAIKIIEVLQIKNRG